MSKLLLVKSSIFGDASTSGRIAGELAERWRARHPSAAITIRDVGSEPLPHFSAAQLRASAASDALIAEVESADVLIVASPMYNFTISSTLKSWIDHVTRAGRTFRYTSDGRPEGLLKNKTTVVVTSRGGVYVDTARVSLDHQEPYLRSVFGFIGLTDVAFVHVEGQNSGAEAAAKGMDRARRVMDEVQTRLYR